MSHPPSGGSSGAPTFDSVRWGRSRPCHVPLLSDSPTNPASPEPTSDQAAGTVRLHRSQGNLLNIEEVFDEANSAGPVAAKELEEMRSRVWWRRPSAIWFLCMKPLVVAASASTTAPKVQVIAHLVCRTLRPEYKDRSGADQPSLFFSPDSEETRLCDADPVVQAASAEFLTLITTATGVLSCITTAYWASRSDRTGRISTMRICVFSYAIADLTYLLVYSLLGDCKGAYWFLLVAPFIEGSLGGMNTAAANTYAYLADCTDPTRRSKIFSVYQGFLYAGTAIGPAFGGLLIRQTGDLRTVFYYALATHSLFTFIVCFIVPESLAPTQLLRAKAAYDENAIQAGGGIGKFSDRLISFLAPLKLLIPVKVTKDGGPLKRKKDWNLTLLAVAYGLANTLIGTYPFKLQYAALTFGWGAEFLGYWMGIDGLTRAITLVFIVPAVISLTKKLSSSVKLSTPSVYTTSLPPAAGDSEALYNHPSRTAASSPPTRVPDLSTKTTPSHGTVAIQSDGIMSTRHSAPPSPEQTAATTTENRELSLPRLDINLARVSLLIELTSYILMAIAKTGATFTAYTVFGGLAVGYAPVIQSLALEVYTGRGGEETGRLLGGLNVVHGLGGSILSPVLFGFTYSRTVATFPQAMFVVGASIIALALLCMLFVGPPRGRAGEFIVVTEDEDGNGEERERLLSEGEE